MIQFPLPFCTEREIAIETAVDLIHRLRTDDVIAVIPVLARYAKPAQSQLQSPMVASSPYLSILGTHGVQAPAGHSQAG